MLTHSLSTVLNAYLKQKMLNFDDIFSDNEQYGKKATTNI